MNSDGSKSRKSALERICLTHSNLYDSIHPFFSSNAKLQLQKYQSLKRSCLFFYNGKKRKLKKKCTSKFPNIFHNLILFLKKYTFRNAGSFPHLSLKTCYTDRNGQKKQNPPLKGFVLLIVIYMALVTPLP